MLKQELYFFEVFKVNTTNSSLVLVSHNIRCSNGQKVYGIIKNNRQI